jgi:hypothetical protein
MIPYPALRWYQWPLALFRRWTFVPLTHCTCLRCTARIERRP